MKKILLTIAICLIFTMGVAANSGSAIIPEFNYFWHSSTYFGGNRIQISNITTEPINVEILLYKSDGTLLNNASNLVTTYNILDFDDSAPKNTFQFSLSGNQSGAFAFNTIHLGALEFGYGIIKWTQDSTAVHGLVARGNIYTRINNTYAYSELSINQGQPF